MADILNLKLANKPKIKYEIINGPKQVLIRMQFTNKKFLLDSVPFHHWCNTKKLLKRAKNSVGSGTRTEARFVCIKQFFAYLLKSEIYFISGVHCYRVAKDTTKYVVVVMFSSSRKGKPFQRLSKSDLEKLNQLTFLDSWQHIKYDRNPNGVWSLTCCHRIPNSQIEGEEIGDLFFEEPDNFASKLPYEPDREYV